MLKTTRSYLFNAPKIVQIGLLVVENQLRHHTPSHPPYTRKTTSYLKLFYVKALVFICAVVFLLSVVIIVSASSGHIYLKPLPFFFYQGVILGCLSLVYPFTIMFLPYLVHFLCYAIQHTLVIIIHHPYYFASLISPPSSPISFTHSSWESGGWSRFIRRLLLPSFEGSPVFFTVCHAFRQALRDVWNF